MLQRYFIDLAYDGTRYFGWQRQPREISVQQELESQLAKLFSGTAIPVTGCGRTDTGVHAHFYVAHFETDSVFDPDQLTYKLNKLLPRDIAVFAIRPVDQSMHARFSATARTYRYFVHQQKSAFLVNSLLVSRELDFVAMNEASKCFLGKQDFTSLSKLHTDVKTNICTVTQAEWVNQGEQWYFEITADRFLRNMVRATVGILLEVGMGNLNPSDVPAILAAKDRGAAKKSVDACGLFLWDVKY